MLEGQCGTWGSIIAASVHVPLVQGKVVSGELLLSIAALLASQQVCYGCHRAKRLAIPHLCCCFASDQHTFLTH